MAKARDGAIRDGAIFDAETAIVSSLNLRISCQLNFDAGIRFCSCYPTELLSLLTNCVFFNVITGNLVIYFHDFTGRHK